MIAQYRPTANVPYSNYQSYEPHYTAININASGDNELVAPVAGKSIVVMQFALVCASAVSVTFESSGGAILSGPMPFTSNSGLTVPGNPCGQFKTVSSEGLHVNLSAPGQVGGHLIYILD